MTCPHCQHDARCKGVSAARGGGLLGTMRLQRHYYYCPSCHRGVCPRDALLGLQTADLTPAADEVVCLSGAQASFAEAARKFLSRLAGLWLSESTVERATEAAAPRLDAARAAGQTFGDARPWPWHRDATGHTVAYVAVDATGVGQQGPKGAAAEGRMARSRHDLQPCSRGTSEQWAHPAGKTPVWQHATWLTFIRRPPWAHPLRRQGRRWAWIRPSVGLPCGWRQRRKTSCRSISRAWQRSSSTITTWPNTWANWRKRGIPVRRKPLKPGVNLVRTAQKRRRSGGVDHAARLELKGRSAAAKACYRDVVLCMQNHVHRMDYPTYRANGWQIGSGPVESACKTVIGQRLKGGGMRWGEDGARMPSAICGRCFAARRASGKRSGVETKLANARPRDAHPLCQYDLDSARPSVLSQEL